MDTKWLAFLRIFTLQLDVNFQQSLVLGNTSHYPVNPSLMIGDYVTPCNGIPQQAYRQWSLAKSYSPDYFRKVKQIPGESRPYSSEKSDNHGNNRKSHRLMFSSPTSKLRLSSATRILDAFDLHHVNPIPTLNDVGHSKKDSVDSLIKPGWKSSKNDSLWDARSKLRAIIS